jgi:hypothetical protein
MAFKDEERNELRLFRNDSNECYIEITDTKADHDYNVQYITMDISDIDALIVELNKIKKEIKENE